MKPTRKRLVDRSQAPSYYAVARAFRTSAEALAELAGQSDTYGNAIALLAIHAAIGYADTLAVAFGGQKSTDDHARAPDLLQGVLKAQMPAEMVKTLRAVIGAKDEVSSQGAYYPLEDGRRLLAKAARFCVWADDLYQRRPPA
ncbi:MAG TPA: hypothetical protein VFS33_04345 [Gemmatimonadales bacterium]|nr:hypothetical protein [Gemmatimonadales bacterium]